MPLPAVRNLKIPQNTDWQESFSLSIDGVLVNLTGYSLRGQCRQREDVDSDLVFPFTFAASGTQVTVSVDASVTAALNLLPGQPQYWYDYLLVAPDGSITKIQKGRLTIEPTVTS